MTMRMNGTMLQPLLRETRPDQDVPNRAKLNDTVPLASKPAVKDDLVYGDPKPVVSDQSIADRTSQGLATRGNGSAEAATKNALLRDFLADQRTLAQDPERFHAAMQEIYGQPQNDAEAHAQRERFEALRGRILDGDTHWLPAAIRFVDGDKLGEGIGGAYSPRDGGTVLLSRDLLNNPEGLRAAFYEEIGHHVDALRQLEPAQLNALLSARAAGGTLPQLSDTRDAAGDEGARFGTWVRTGQVPESTGIEGRSYVPGLGEVENHTVLDDEVRSVHFDNPSSIQMHPTWTSSSLGPAFRNGALDLNAVTPEMLRGLSPNNLKTFFGILDGIKARGSLTLGSGRTSRGTANAATFMAGRVWGSGDSETFSRVFAAAPNRILPFLSGNGSRVLTAENMALIMREMRASGESYSVDELDALGALVQTYLERNVGNDPERVGAAMLSLLTEVNRSGLPFTAENAGVVSGVIVAGMLRHFEKIRASDAQRARIIGNVTSTVSVAAGMAGTWGKVVGVALRGLNTVYQEIDRPRDYAEHASRFQAAMNLEWMQNPPQGWDRDDVQDAILWVDIAIKASGER